MLLALGSSWTNETRWVAALLIPLCPRRKGSGGRGPGVDLGFLENIGTFPPLPLGLPATGGRPRRWLPGAGTAHRGVRNSSIACGGRTITVLSDFFFLTFHPNAGLLGSTVGDTVWRSLSSWQRFLRSLSAASCIGKFHPFTLGLYVTTAEMIDRVHLICCKRERQPEKMGEHSIPLHKGRIEQGQWTKELAGHKPSGGHENLPWFLGFESKIDAYLDCLKIFFNVFKIGHYNWAGRSIWGLILLVSVL